MASTAKDVVRAAVIGCGIVGKQQHVPALQKHSQAELVACCDMNESALQAAASGTDAATYTDVEAMIKSEDLDAVHVCTPPHTRVPIAETLAPAGINILFEKPVADTTESVDRLRELRDEHDVVMSVVHNKLFTPHYRAAKRRVRDGEIGDVVAVSMLFGETTDPDHTPRGDWVYDLPGGEIGEGLPHQAYLPLAFVEGLGDVTCVSKQQFKDTKTVDFDGVAIEATDETGRVLVSIRVLTNSTMQDRLLLNGTDGELTVDHHRKGVFDTSTGGAGAKDLVTDSFEEAGQLAWNVGETGFGFAKRLAYERMDDERSEAANGHFVLISEFLRAVQTNGTPPVTLEEGRETIRLIEAIE